MASSGIAEKNNLVGNGLVPGGCGLSAGAGRLATNNYWGAATGPGPGTADDECGPKDAVVTPFATKPFKVEAPIKQ